MQAKTDPFSRSRSQEPLANAEQVVLVTGNANRQLAGLIASRLSLPLAESSVKKYADGETGVEIF